MMRGSMSALAAVAMICSSSVGCQFDPWASRYTKVQPGNRLLDGVYRAMPDSLAYLNEHHYPNNIPLIELKPDGTFCAEAMPDCWISETGESKGRLYSGTGRWRIVKHQEWWAVSLSFAAPFGPYPEGFGTDVMLIGDKAPYTLILTIGDPDSGEVLQLSR